MTTPTIKVAVRKADGEAQIYKVAHESIRNHDHARELFKNEIPDARVILALVPTSEVLV